MQYQYCSKTDEKKCGKEEVPPISDKHNNSYVYFADIVFSDDILKRSSQPSFVDEGDDDESY